MNQGDKSSQVNSEEMAFILNWISLLTGAKSKDQKRHSTCVPFSFTCGTRSSRDWIKLETASHVQEDWHDGKRLHVLSWHDSETSLSCTFELTEFRDFPTMEWVIHLRNTGSNETPPVANFKALDVFWHCAGPGETPELHRAYGSDGRYDDFQYLRDEMRQSMWDAPRTIRMDSTKNKAFRKARNGSPGFHEADSRTSATWLPFFNLRSSGDGIMCALGWCGQWFAEFAHDGASRTDISAGMEHLELQLRLGEEIRSPRILLLYWQDEYLHAHNVFRQFVLKYHSPQTNNRPVGMPVCNGSWGGTPTQGHLDIISRIAGHGLSYDYYWVDAGWYGTSTKPCPDVFHGDWGITGDWQVNRNYHPDGLKPISDAAHQAGMKFLLWIEPLRAKYATPVTLEHPEWFLHRDGEKLKPNDDVLLNLGHPGAWQWVVDTVSALITANGVDCYREDFNIDPASYWAYSDEKGRKGLTEMRFVEGLYRYWDELHNRHPGLLIDNCASGGRRLELETISRSVALWRTDYNCFPFMKPEASQLHGVGLNLWVPLNATSPVATPGDTYQARSAYSAGLVLSIGEFGINDVQAPDFPWDWYRKRIDEVKRLQPYFLGDFYPLTPCVIDPAAWMAYQLQQPQVQEGAVLAFRRPESPMTLASFQLQGLLEESMYEIECADSGQKWLSIGRDLMTKGLAIDAKTPRSSRLLFYSIHKALESD